MLRVVSSSTLVVSPSAACATFRGAVMATAAIASPIFLNILMINIDLETCFILTWYYDYVWDKVEFVYVIMRATNKNKGFAIYFLEC